MGLWTSLLVLTAGLAFCHAKSTSKTEFWVALPENVYFQISRMMEKNVNKLTQEAYQEIELLMWDHIELVHDLDKGIYNPDADPTTVYIIMPYWVFQKVTYKLQENIGSFTLQIYREIQLLLWDHIEFLEPTLLGRETRDDTCPLGADYSGSPKGHVTHYSNDPTGNNCDLNWANLEASGLAGWTFFAALPKNPGTENDRYEAGLNCGRCVKVKCSCDQELFPGACQPGGEEAIVMVTDSCPSCPNAGDLDLSTDAWNKVTGNEGFSKYDGTWEFVDCPSSFKSGAMKLRMKGGTSKYWYAFQPENHINKIVRIEMTSGGQTRPLTFGEIDGFWWKGEEMIDFPATVKVYSEAGGCWSAVLEETDVGGDNEVEMDANCDGDEGATDGDDDTTDDGATDDGATDGGATDDGATDDGATDDGATDDGATGDGATDGDSNTGTNDDTDDETGGETDECESSCDLLNIHNWSSGITGAFSIVVPEDTSKWEMTVTFDKKVSRLEAYEGKQEKCTGKVCTFTNEHWNGRQKAGDTLTLNFQGHGRFPTIVSFAFNGKTCYGEEADAACAEKRAKDKAENKFSALDKLKVLLKRLHM